MRYTQKSIILTARTSSLGDGLGGGSRRRSRHRLGDLGYRQWSVVARLDVLGKCTSSLDL